MASLSRYLLAGLGLAVLLFAIVAGIHLAGPRAPAGPDLSRSKVSAAGLFQASIEPEGGIVREGEMRYWVLTLKTAAGAPVENAAIDISGGMPRHNHGLPTSPQATDYLGQGRYRIGGLKFTMAGWWQLHFAISAAAGSDTVVFNVVL